MEVGMTTRSKDDTSGLHALGSGSMNLSGDGPGIHLLEAFPNRFQDRFYVVSISFPEFTSLCPVTGQPDFGTIVMEYIPSNLCVESKSFKLYMFAYRNHQSLMETITNSILDDMVKLLDPAWCRIRGLFAPRGATRINVYAEHFGKLNGENETMLRSAVAAWKAETHPLLP